MVLLEHIPTMNQRHEWRLKAPLLKLHIQILVLIQDLGENLAHGFIMHSDGLGNPVVVDEHMAMHDGNQIASLG